jgi:hypothetical protein
MQLSIGPHLEESELEQYSMGILPQGRMDVFEEHFLACDSCQDRLLEMEAYVNAVRSVSPKLRQSPASSWSDFRAKLFAGRRPVWATALALGVISLAILRVGPVPDDSREMIAVSLQSSRGVEGLAAAKAPAGKPLLLKMDITELQAFPSYRLEIVGQTGQQILETVARPESGAIVQPVRKRLPAGQYFVRLFAPTGELLREFSLGVN